MLFLFIFILFVFNLINVTLFILLIYATLINLLFLVNGWLMIHNILSINQLWSTRLYEIGIISKVFCLYFGLSGLLSRSANILIDARLTGYEFYQCLKYSLFISSIGDCLDRYLLRLNEIIESCRIIYAVIYPLLGSVNFICYSYFIMYLMELLIEEFLISFPLILSFINELKLSIESSKGIYSIYIQSFPYLTINIISCH